MSEKMLVLFSGGVDSTAALLWAMKSRTTDDICALSVDCGQPRGELAAGYYIAKRLGVARKVVNCGPLYNPIGDTFKECFIPSRNSILISIASNLASRMNARHIVTGFGMDDSDDFPDTREPFLSAIEWAIGIGGVPVVLHHPVLKLSKSQIVNSLNQEILSLTWSCYFDCEEQCGTCPSCMQRVVLGKRPVFRAGEKMLSLLGLNIPQPGKS